MQIEGKTLLEIRSLVLKLNLKAAILKYITEKI